MKDMYEKGTVKVVWIDGGEKIYSKMLDDEEKACSFSQNKKDFLIFKLLSECNMEEFTWKLLPHGRFDLYSKLLKIYKKGVLSKLLRKF